MMRCRRRKTTNELVSSFLSFLILFFHTDSVSLRTWTQINHRCQIHLPPVGPIRSQSEDTPQTLGQIQWDSSGVVLPGWRVCPRVVVYVYTLAMNSVDSAGEETQTHKDQLSDIWSQQWRSKTMLPYKNGQKVMGHNLLQQEQRCFLI